MSEYRQYDRQGRVIGGLIVHAAEPSVTVPLTIPQSVYWSLSDRREASYTVTLSLGADVYRLAALPEPPASD